MTKTITWLLAFSLFFFSCTDKENHLKDIHIVTFNETQKEYLINYILYKNYNIKIIDNDNYTTLKKVNENILIDILQLLYLKTDIIKDNIVNANTTKTAEEGPFIRNYLKITKENGAEILKDTTPVRLVYDPTHPDAIRNGTSEGYVQFPNVNLITEYHELTETIKLYNGIVDYIKLNYKQIAIEKMDIMTIDEIEHNIRIVNFLELFLRFSLEKR